MQTGKAVKLVRTFFEAYLVRRDVIDTLACLAEDVQWVGTGKSELTYGRDRTAEALLAEFAVTPEPFRIEYEYIQENEVTDTSAAVLLTASVCPAAKEAGGVWIRVSAICVEDMDGTCRIASIHASTPDIRQDEGEFFPASLLTVPNWNEMLG
ncbi:nuclear transport factor 2 family protein [Clostridium sp. AM58-1XD]|uniref:nuclear transport factor 2 family protein n=1 Tax=Clostridium sp. AM58-1XD TaxID=2292307 RepID=UPI001FA8EFB5|nr:nuclear transport factor 2 family protein [Clostridium sp. AM58-1XD]